MIINLFKEYSMRLLVQRVTEASVSINSKVVGSIEHGFLVLIGIAQEDDEHIADILINKLHFFVWM